MRKIRKCGLITGMLAILCLMCSVGITMDAFAMGDEKPEGETVIWADVEIEEVYAQKALLTVPQRKLSVGETTVKTKHVLTMPSGEATTLNEVILSQAGNYQLTYSANVNGKSYAIQEDFFVENPNYSFNSKDSYAEYGSSKNSPKAKGLVVSLAKGDTITFNDPVKVSNLTMEDILIELFATPEKAQVKDFNRINITFTDVTNPDVYLKFSAAEYGQQTLSYCLVGANGQPMVGYEKGFDRVHKGSWGTPTVHSFWGISEGNAKLCFSYDEETMVGYAHYESRDPMMIADFDDSYFFMSVWKGFESEYAYCSISCDEYTADRNAKFVVTDILGLDLETKVLSDNQLNEIVLDSSFDLEKVPSAMVGREYPIPDAKATNLLYGACKLNTQVWYNYASDKKISVQITDGSFVPTREGRYAIVYTTVNRYGVETRKIVWVDAYKELPIEVVLSDGIEQSVVGETVSIKQATITGGSGKLSSTITASLNGEAVIVENERFRPLEVGQWTITYKFTDYLGQEEIENYTLNVIDGNSPVFMEEAELPYTFIEGNSYTFAPYKAQKYANGTWTDVETKVYVLDANGEKEISAGMTFVPMVAQSGDEVTVKYVAETAEKIYKIKTVKAFENLQLNLKNYFFAEGVTFDELGENGLTVVAQQADGGFYFARELLAEGFELTWNADTLNNHYSGLIITLTDLNDASTVIEAKILKNENKAKLIVGKISKALSSGFTVESESTAFSLKYSNGTLTCGKTSVVLTEKADGSVFNGFASGLVTLNVRFIEASDSQASFTITSVNKQLIKNSTSDRFTPSIVILAKNYGGLGAYGSNITLPAAMAMDVLDDDVSFKMSVIGPDGTPITAIDGTRLLNVDPTKCYEITLSSYGQYVVRYNAVDSFSGIPQNFSYAINVIDEEGPNITLSSTPVEKVSMGETIIIPNITVIDNISSECKVIKTVFTPKGSVFTLEGSCNSIVASYQGEYQIMILAIDDAGNMASFTYTVKVV